MKLYARQVNPEYQESPLYYEEDFPENIIITGNRDFNSHTTWEYDKIIEWYEVMCEYYEEIKAGEGCYKNITELLKDYFPGKYSTKTIHKFKEVLEKYGTRYYYEGDYILDMLEIITGKKWHKTTICGSVQREWQNVIYSPEDYSKEYIKELEVQYFNTGTEWIIHEYDEEPEEPEDITGYSVYCTSWNTEGIKKELTDAAGYEPEEIILYEFSGYTKTEVFKRMGA